MEKNEISVADLFRSLLRHLPIILAVTLVFGIASWGYSRFFVAPKYTATAKMIAISNIDRTNKYYTSAEHTAAVALVNTTAAVIKTESILNEASERLGKDGLVYTPDELKKMITVSSENETEVFRLIVTGTRQQDVAIIANTVADVTEAKIGMITDAGGAKELERAVTPTKQSSPNVIRNTILGALAGFVLMSLAVILRDLYDTTIWTEDDLTNHYKYPVLGMVPQIDDADAEEKKEKYESKSKYESKKKEETKPGEESRKKEENKPGEENRKKEETKPREKDKEKHEGKNQEKPKNEIKKEEKEA